MPLYAYFCDRCQTKFEFWRGFDDPPVTVCPDCETPTLRKLYESTPVHFKIMRKVWGFSHMTFGVNLSCET